MNDAEIRLQVKVDGNTATTTANRIGKAFDDAGKKISAVGKSITTKVTLPIIGLGVYAVKSASDLNENINKTEVAFKDAADEVKAFAKTTLKTYGISESAALDMASLFGDMGTAMKLDTKTAAKMSKKLVGLAGDMASFKNISIERAQVALAGIYTGETESLKSLGIVMTEVNLEEYARTQGIKKSVREMTQAEKVQLRYNYVLEQTVNAQGDYERTAQGTANLTRTATENFKELSADLGQQLLPIVNKLLTGLIGLVDWFKNLDEKQKQTILTVLGMVAAVGPLITIVGNLTTGIGMATKAIGLFAGNPTLLMLGLMAAAIAVIVVEVLKVKKAMDETKKATDDMIQTVTSVIKSKQKVVEKVIESTNQEAKDFLIKSEKASLASYQSRLKSLDAEIANAKKNPIGWLFVKDSYSKQRQALVDSINASKKSLASLSQAARFKDGTNYVPQNGLAFLHKGEAVIPKNVADDYRNMSNNVTNNFNIDKLDVRSDNDINLIAEQLYYLQKKAVV